MAGQDRSKDAVHRARFAVGERLLRELQLKLRDEFLNGEIFYSMKELRVLAERWRVHYNTIRPHSSLGLQITGTRGMADKQHGVWRSGNRYALPTSPHPRRRLLELRRSCATLTHPTAQKIGHSIRLILLAFDGGRSSLLFTAEFTMAST